MKKFILPFTLLFFSVQVWATNGEAAGENMIEMMAHLTLQLGVIIIAARLGGLVFEKLHIPSVLGELILGVLIGPYLLGGIGFPGFPGGIFPPIEATAIPVSPELYGIATIASIILLFVTGLETDLALLLKFSLAGIAVGVSGVLASFVGGAAAGMFFFDLPFFDPRILFLGVISTATSVGITARVLSERRKMDSPEGVTILAGAVIDDVLGIILLAIVTGLSAVAAGQANPDVGWRQIEFIALRAILVWLGFTVAGILLAGPLSRGMKKLKSVTNISVFALGLALILAGIFEMAGLAMIIGAYVMGLSLSKTDLNDTVRETLEGVYSFFVPVFFVVMGMLVNLGDLFSREVLLFGAIYTVIAVAAKIFGCGLPTLFLNFNRLGATRIGMGMVPRGEVALIIAGIGLSTRVIDQRFFGASVLMTLITTMMAPPLLSRLFKSEKKGTKKTFLVRNTVSTPFDFGSTELTNLLELRVIQSFRNEGFYVHSVPINTHAVYQLRKNEILITMNAKDEILEFETDAQDVIYVKTIVYEALLQLNDIIAKVKDLIKPELLLKGLTDATGRMGADIHRILDSRCIIPNLRSKTKNEVIEELLEVLNRNGMISDRDAALDSILEREQSMSTGMQHGVALPHGKTDAVSRITVAIGLSRHGIDFQSIDGEPSKIFVLILSPLNTGGPHIQFLASLSALLNSPEARDALLACKSREEIYWFFRRGLGK